MKKIRILVLDDDPAARERIRALVAGHADIEVIDRSGAARGERLVIKSAGRLLFLRADDIDWVEAAGNYVKLHVGAEEHLLRETLNGIELKLDPDRFFRIHRSRIVNMERIRELQPWFNGEYVVILGNGTKLTLSRGYREKLQERLGRRL
ncbi:MAG TPA: LytTR family transcriptional regulator DNA-binding domain-containing protein [Vicinamibacterales bacterium]